MAVCMFWLLTYVGQGLDLAVGNRPMIIQVQGAQGLDYRHGSGGIRKKSELNSVGSNLLHFRIYPSDGTVAHRDDLSNWLLLNEEPRISSWSPAGMLIDDIVKEPRELPSVFLGLTPPAMLPNVLYPEHGSSPYQHVAEPYVHDDGNSLIPGGRQSHQRTRKRRLGCRHPRGPLGLPILVCDDAGRKTVNALQEPRQSNNQDDHYAERLNTATISTKTDLARAEAVNPLNSSPNGGGFGAPRGLVYETGKLPGSKRNQIVVGRRSIDVQAESPGHQAQASSASSASSASASIASQFMLRSIRGTVQYDVPQIGKRYYVHTYMYTCMPQIACFGYP